MLGVVGLANAVVGAVGLLAEQRDLSTLVATALLVAGLATVALALPVWRGNRRAVVVALVVFELLLVPRLVALGDASGPQRVSIVVLLVVVATLGWATWRLRQRARATT